MTREPHTVRASLQRDALLLDGDDLTAGHKGAIIGVLNEHAGGDDARRIMASWVFDWTPEKRVEQKSSKTWTEGQWRALAKWIDAYQHEETEEWLISESFKVEVKVVTRVACAFYDYARVCVVDELIDDDLPPMVREAIILGGVIKEVKDDEE